VEDLTSEDAVTQLADRLRAELARPFELAGREYFVSASVGVAVSDPDADGPEDLLRDADAAMYQAKDRGRNQIAAFDSTLRGRLLRRLDLVHDLHRSIERDELLLHYQPLVDVATGEVAGLEALLRWVHPEQGVIPPGEFIPVAEDTGLILELGDWVIREAIRQIAVWNAARPSDRPLFVSVNVSARQLGGGSLLDTVAEALATAGVPGGQLCLEITESALMADPELAASVLHGARALGARVAIDDFGTGYSSLAYLRELPVGVLKIDRTFVAGLDSDGRDLALIQAVLGLAEEFGMIACAEGVETSTQLEKLHAAGCTLAQGYLFARPQPAAELSALIGIEAPVRYASG
jgi:EAL domain-containing protein (putative c-di-GMP-specific phosphodiesterase class I)